MYWLFEKGYMDGLPLWPFRMRPGRPGSRRWRRCHCCHPIQTLGRHRGLALGRSHRKGRPRPLLTAGSDETTSLPSFSDTWFNENLELAGSLGHTPAEKSILELTWGQVFINARLTQSKQYLASTLQIAFWHLRKCWHAPTKCWLIQSIMFPSYSVFPIHSEFRSLGA